MAINFEIGLRLTDKELKSQLAGINKDLTRAFTVKNADGGFSKEIAAAATQAKALDKALRAATTNKGISYAQLNMELAKAGTTAGKLTSTLAQGGTYFRHSLDQANNALALSNRHVLSLNRVLQEVARVFKQSFKFTVAQTAIRAIGTEIRESVQWVTNLNDAVNNIAVVTGKTATQITAVTDQAIKGSKDLRIAAEDYAKGALIFYQQGLNDEEVIRRNEITIKAAKAANQSIEDMSKQLTAVWNTYGMVGEEQLRAASVGAKMAAQTAVDFSDIAQAMQTAAAPAAQMGVEYNQLAAIIATVGDTTQQSASIIGNAYKTIFSRFQQLVSDGTDGEVTLGSVSKKLNNLGVQIMNSDGTLKNLGKTINEVGNNWENWSQEQQLAIAQLVGGTRQYGLFLALMENFDKYQKNLQSAAGETGSTLERQYTQALDSIESRAENAGEAWHRAFSNIITADEIKSAYNALEQVGTAVDNIIKGMGGLPGILSIVSVLLSSKIVPALQIAGKTALTLGASLIGKQGAMINRDFNQNATEINKNTGLKDSEKEVALAKNEFSRQTAVINEQINSQLARATGLRRTELEMQREQLVATQQNFSATMSEAQALEQKLQNQLKIYQVEGDNIGNLELQAQKEQETVQLLEEQLRILQEQSKQKTIIKNDARLGEDYKYQGTANERRAQNRAFIAQAQSKLDTARTNYGKTMDALDAVKIVEGNQKEEQSINKLVVAYGKLQSALSNYQKQKLAGKTNEAAKSMRQAKLAAADLAQGLQIVRDNGAMTDQEMTEFRNTLETLDDNVDLTKVSDQLSSIGQAMSGMTTQGENAQQVLSSTQTKAVQTAQQLGEATGIIAQQQQEQAKAAALAAQYQEATLSEGISLTVQFASASVMALNSIKNMWDIYNNPDLSGGEKALQMITSMTSALMFTLPAFTAVVKKVQEFGRASILASIAQKMVADGSTKQAAAAAAATAAQKASGAAAMKAGLMAQTAWGPLLPVVLAITAAVAALAIAFGFAYSEAKNNSPEEQLKKAEAAAEQLAEAEEVARQKADDLRSAIENYDSAIDTLNKCTKGTKEWEEALVEVNSQVTGILKKFPELLKEQNLFNQDGTLNKDVLDKAQQQADALVISTSAVSLMGQVNAENKRTAVATSQMTNRYESHVVGGGVTYDYNRGHTDGSYSSVSADLQKVLQQYESIGSKALELSDIYSILGNVTEDYAEDMLKLAQSQVDATQMMENANKLIINEWADSNGEELAKGQAELMADEQQKHYDSFAKAFKEASDQNNKVYNVDHSVLGSAFDGTSFEGMSVTEAFNAARGTSYSLAGNGVRGTISNRSYVYLENGEEKEYKLEEMQATVAAVAALQKMGESADTAAQMLDGMSEEVRNFIGDGNLENLTEEEFNSLKEEVGGDDGEVSVDEAKAYLIAKGMSEELAEKYASSFAGAFSLDFDDIGKNLSQSMRKVFGDMDLSGLTAATQRKVADLLSTAYENNWKNGEKTSEILGEIIDSTGKNAGKAIDILNGIDWNNITDEELITQLERAGISTTKFKNKLPELINLMEQIAEIDFSSASKTYKNLQEIIEGVKDNGTISEEEFQKLSEAGVNVDTFFTQLKDGSYVLTGSAEDFCYMAEKVADLNFGQVYQNALNKVSVVEDAMQNSQDYTGEGTYYNKITEKGFGVDQAGWFGTSIGQTYNMDEIKEMVTYIEAAGGNITSEMQEMLDRGTMTYKVYRDIVEEVKNCGDVTDQWNSKLYIAQEEVNNLKETLELSALIEDASENGVNPKELKEYGKMIQEMVDDNEELSDALKGDEIGAQKVGLAYKRAADGRAAFADKGEDLIKQLKSENKFSKEYQGALKETSDIMADFLNIDVGNLSADFVTDAENLDLLKQAAEGSEEALDKLARKYVADIIANFDIDQESKTQLEGFITELAEMDNIEIDAVASLDDSQYIDALNTMLANGQITKQQVNDMLAGIGYEPQWYKKTVPVEAESPAPKTITVGKWTPVTSNQEYAIPQEDGTIKRGYLPITRYVYNESTEVAPDTETIEGSIDIAGYSGEGAPEIKGEVHQVTGAKKISGSGNKSTSPVTSPITAPPPVKTGGSGGGRSGSKTPVKKVDKTERKDKLRYKDNENAVEDVTNALNRLSKANEHAFGPQKIRNINLMNIQLARQAKAYQALYDEAKMYTKLDALALDSGLADFNAKYGTALKAEYDGDNLLNNEMELLNIITDLQNAKIAEINAVEDELNKLADKGVLQDDPQVDALNKQLETLKENLSTLDTDVESMVKKNLDNYQEAIRKAEETMEKMVDILYQGLENEIEKYTIARDLHLQINELEQKHWEAIMDNMGAVGKLGRQVADMLKKSLGSINDSVERYTKHYTQMEEVQKRWENRDITLKAEYGISDEVWDRAQQSGMIPQQIMDKFAGDIDALMDLRQQVWDNLDKQWQNYIDTIQHYIDEYDRITDRLDKQASISDNLMHVIETVGFNYKWGADESKSYYKNMETQLDIVKNKAAAVNGELAIATNRRKEAEEELNKLLAGRSVMEFSNSANEAEMFEYNRIKEHYDDMASLEAELNAQRVELLAQAYDKAVEYAEKWGEIIAHEADEALNGAFDTLDEAMDMYNQKRNIDTFFMDDIDKAFELNKLKREVEDVIDDISDPEQLERYNKLLAEIEAKKEAGVKMTEKDLEILRAQFDLEQARDAYQDARNAKNTMRLTRDASGNYTYVYSEDEQSVEDQEAKVEEAMHNIYKMNRDAADEYAETWLQLQVDWENYYRSIDQARYEQDVKYRDMVDQRMKWYAEQSDLLSNEIMKHNDSIDRSFTDMTLSVITNTEDMASTNDMYKEHHTQLKEKLVQNYQEWIEKADETMREVGGSMSDLEQVVDEETDKMMTEVDNLREEIDTLNVEAQSALGDLAGYIGTWCSDVNREFDTVIAEIDRLIQKYLEMLRVMSQKADAAVNAGSYDKGTDYNAYMSIDYQRYKDAGGELTPTEWLEKFHRSDIEERILAGADRGIAAGTTYEEALKIMAQEVVDNLGYDSSKGYNYGGGESKKELNNYIEINGDVVVQPKTKAATGGLFNSPNITGIAEEGPELVLNNADTENILNAVKAIRGIVQSQIGAVELGMIGKTGRIADITPFIPKSENQSVDQTVHIDASFPGVSAAAEIETALNNLIVQAAHYSLNNRQN